MPEGHTLHRLAKLHHKRFASHPVRVASPQGRFSLGAARVDGQVLLRAEAWGKHLLHRYESGLTVHVHLGLYGTFTELTGTPGEPVGQVRMRMTTAPRADEPAYAADLRGPTKCEVLDELAVQALTSRLGPDPLRRDADPDRAWQRIHRSTRPIAAVLLDQGTIAGIGNVYRAEVLFRHGISPYRPGNALSKDEWDGIWQDLAALMKDGVRVGRIDTVRREHDPRVVGRAPRKDRHGGEVYVYRRAGMPCHACGTSISYVKLDNRNLFWCNTCQPT